MLPPEINTTSYIFMLLTILIPCEAVKYGVSALYHRHFDFSIADAHRFVLCAELYALSKAATLPTSW